LAQQEMKEIAATARSHIRSPNIVRRSHNRHVLVLMFTYNHRYSPIFFSFFK
jgi:hypothetical protein